MGGNRELESYHSRPILIFLDSDAHRLFGQEIFDEFWPFDEAETTTVEILLKTDVVGLRETLDAVEVEVVDGLSLSVLVFVDDGEGRRVDDILHTQFFAKSLGEGSLSHAHLAVEGKDGTAIHRIDELSGRLSYRLQ